MICIDSDCIIDFLKGKREAVRVVEQHTGALATTEINVFEVLVGIHLRKLSNQEEQAALAFFDAVEILGKGPGWGSKASSIFSALVRQGREIEQNDCLIAGMMLANNCGTILTGNARHFSRIKEIQAVGYG